MTNLTDSKIKLSYGELEIITKAMKEHLETKGMGLQSSDIFDAEFMETCANEARVMKRLADHILFKMDRVHGNSKEAKEKTS